MSKNGSLARWGGWGVDGEEDALFEGLDGVVDGGFEFAVAEWEDLRAGGALGAVDEEHFWNP